MEEQNNSWLIGAIVAVLVLIALCMFCACAGGAIWLILNSNSPGPAPVGPGTTIEPETPWEPWEPEETEVPATPIVEPAPDEAKETLKALEAAVIPDSDLHEMGIRFLGVPADTPRTKDQSNPDYEIGTRRLFHASDVDTDRQFDIYATLVYKTDHLYMWVEEGANVNERRLREAADLFEEHTYPTDREFFGTEWTPGVDNDPHLSVLHARNLGNTVAGYFSSADSYVAAVREDSNEMEMFYINISNVSVGDDFYNGVLAHEFQHMIHWYNDSNEDTWLNEGCSELAMYLNDKKYPGGHYDVGGSEYSYFSNPDTQLTSWPEGTAGDASANYGGAFLFVRYFLSRFGEDATKALVSHQENSMESVDVVLKEDLKLDITHKEVFADWTAANLINDYSLADGQYGYEEANVGDVRIGKTFDQANDFPAEERAKVKQYGADYIEVQSDIPLRFTFTGSTQVELIDTDAHSGKYLWWSNRSDESDSRLTRIVDLSNANEATLRFWGWYHIEEDWDYAYVVVGTTDNGKIPDDLDSTEIHWEILSNDSLHCTSNNPNSNNFGCGFTGKSRDWDELEADLSEYAGKEIALRFEYVTDAAVNQSGFAIDDIEILVDGQSILSDDVENGVGDWIAEGFVRHANVLPQEWIVQMVLYGNTPTVEHLMVGDGTQGNWVIPFDARMDKAVLIISAIAPVTTEAASYEYTLTPEN
ncbi:MAG: immune inhibitor A [Anaerolineae bacterium]|nr:immune inhibitor A [Anaerolineae bacterium]